MRSLLSFLIAVLMLAISCSPVSANSMTPLSTLPGLGNIFAGNQPETLGLHNEQLSPCPESPNCVLSQSPDESHAIAPITYSGDIHTAQQTLLKVLSVVPRTTIIQQTDSYIQVEFKTQLMGFVDDGEFYFPPNEKLIHVRSASRLGESDLNLNRRRIEQIRLAMTDLDA